MAEIEKSIEADRAEFVLTILEGEIFRHAGKDNSPASMFAMGFLMAMKK